MQRPWTMLVRLWQMLRHTKEVFLSPGTPLRVKIVLVLGLLYVLSPYDLIPEWVPVIGLMDDLALVILLVTWVNSSTLPKKQ